jgi:hypothetical protein
VSVQADEDYKVPVEPFPETNDDFSSAAIIETSTTTALTTAIGSTAGDEAIIDDDWENENDEDTAEDVLFKRSWKLSKLGMALGLWVSSLFNIACLTHCKTLGYQHIDLSLRVDGASPDYQGFTRWPARVQNLPTNITVLKAFVREQLPLTKMRVKTILLLPEKQVRDKLTEDLYFIDPVKLVETILSSDVAQKMHFGLAHRVNNPTELFRSKAWASSIRTTFRGSRKSERDCR